MKFIPTKPITNASRNRLMRLRYCLMLSIVLRRHQCAVEREELRKELEELGFKG